MAPSGLRQPPETFIHLDLGHADVAFRLVVGERHRQVVQEAQDVVASAVPTGEDLVPLHYVVPTHDFDVTEGHLGAIEVTASVGSLRIDTGAAKNQLSPASATRLARIFERPTIARLAEMLVEAPNDDLVA